MVNNTHLCKPALPLWISSNEILVTVVYKKKRKDFRTLTYTNYVTIHVVYSCELQCVSEGLSTTNLLCLVLLVLYL